MCFFLQYCQEQKTIVWQQATPKKKEREKKKLQENGSN